MKIKNFLSYVFTLNVLNIKIILFTFFHFQNGDGIFTIFLFVINPTDWQKLYTLAGKIFMLFNDHWVKK